MGPQEDYIETVFTCEGDINDPNLHSRLEDFQSRLRELLSTDKRKLILKKVEPWNSVRVTFNIPREAAWRLKQLAQQGNVTLRQLGVLAVQIEGDQLISLTIAGRNNERTQLFFRTADDTVDTPNLPLIDSGGGGTNHGSPGPTNVQSTRKNITEYLRQGAGASIFDSIFTTQDGESLQSAAIPQGRPPNLLGQNSNFHQDRKTVVNASSHTPLSYSAKTSTGNVFSNFQQEYEQNSSGQDKPPPPPYPEGSAWFNNVAKGIRGIPPTTSPLLVNLLQTEPSLAGINNFINSKMLPPPPDTSPPLKKKRKPRKPKDKIGCEAEATSTTQSLTNPIISSYSMPTSGSASNILPVPMVTQALAANTQPSVTFSKSVPTTADMLYASSASGDIKEKDKFASSQNYKAGSKVSKGIYEPSHESTAEKIINPYTGLLEPMEHSDLNPTKNCIQYERLSPQSIGLKNPGLEQTQLSKEKINHVFSHAKVQSNSVSSVPTSCTSSSMANFSLQQCRSETQSVGSHNQGSDSLSVTMSVWSSSSTLSSSQNHNLVQSSPIANVSKSSDIYDLSRKTYSQSRTCSAVCGTSDTYRNAIMHGFHHTVPGVMSGGPQTNTAESTYSSRKHLSSKDHLKKNSSENLLNPSKNPAKLTGSSSDRSHGVDSENSNHTGLIHDTHMQNDIGAVTTGCTETNSKSYYNDSGVGSSSERSDDTPSEPGDSDFKSGNNHIEEFSKSLFHENLTQKQNLLNKTDQQIITVGYALSNPQHNEKHNNDVSNILAIDKALNHPALKKRNSEILKQNSDHQVAMHLLNKNKKRSPKHFLNDEAISSLTKEHLQLLHKVDSMQYLKDNFQNHGYEGKSNQHVSANSRLTVPGRLENHHSPINIHPGARTPSPRLLTNHDAKETFDVSLCNKIRKSGGNTPVSEVEALQNDLASKLLEQHQNISSYLSQKKHERKAKSPISGMNLTVSAAMELISLENMMSVSSVNSALGKHGEGITAQGIIKNDIINNIKRPDNLAGLSESDSGKVSKSGAYKRRSPASAMLNPLPQQFYDPKKLTESVQKLVKPLISESASLPHSQRRSPGSVGSRACTSPQSQKSDGPKRSDSAENLDNVIMQESDSISSYSSHSVNSDILFNSTSDLPKLEPESEMKNLNTSVFNHILNEKIAKSNDLQISDRTSATSKEESGNHSLNSQESISSGICAVSAGVDSSIALDVSVDTTSTTTDEKGVRENSRQKIIEKVPTEGVSSNRTDSQYSVTSTQSEVRVPTNNSIVDTTNTEADKTMDKNVKVNNKNCSKKSENLCNTVGVEYSSLKVNCDSEKISPKSSQKSPNLSPMKKGKSEDTRPIKLHLSHGVITNPQPYSKEELATETNITVITRSDPRKMENSAGEPTVPPLVLKVSRKTAVEPPTEQKLDESQSLTMSLRARKASEITESAHNLRQPKPIRQKSIDQTDMEQYKIVEDSSSKVLRQSRRRKTNSSENEGGVDSEKKAHIDNCLQEADQKMLKNEETNSDTAENLFDTVKSGLRARAQNKTVNDEKLKVSPKDLKHSKSIEEDPNVKRNSQIRRNRQSPTLSTDKQPIKEPRDKSPGRISRTRSGQISPSVEDDNGKRATRSAKPKNQIVETQTDATDTLPPPSKRRRTTSRDHR